MLLPVTVERVVAKVLGRDGHLEQGLRRDIFRYSQSSADKMTPQEATSREIDPAVKPFIEKVTTYPYKVVDRDIEHLKSLGFSEDQIFEMTVSVAVGAGSGRLSLTSRLIEESKKCD